MTASVISASGTIPVGWIELTAPNGVLVYFCVEHIVAVHAVISGEAAKGANSVVDTTAHSFAVREEDFQVLGAINRATS